MNTEKITKQLNKRMENLVNKDDFYKQLNVGIEFEFLFDFEKFENNNKSSNESSNSKNENRQEKTENQSIKDFQNNLYQFLIKDKKVNFDILEDIFDSEVVDDIRSNESTKEDYIGNLFGYYKRLLGLIEKNDSSKYQEILNQVLNKYLKPLFTNENEFIFNIDDDNQLKVSYKNQDGNLNGMSKRDRRDNLDSFIENEQVNLFSDYESEELKSPSVQLKPFLPVTDTEYIYGDSPEGVLQYDYTVFFQNIIFSGMGQLSTMEYERRFQNFQSSSYVIIDAFNNKFNNENYSQELQELKERDQTSSQIGEYLFNLFLNNIFKSFSEIFDGDISNIKKNIIKFAQSLIEGVSIKYSPIGKDLVFFNEYGENIMFYDFFNEVNRFIMFQQLIKQEMYKEQIQSLQTYNIKRLFNNPDLMQKLIKVIEEHTGLSQNISSFDSIIDKIKILDSPKKVKYAQSLFNEKLEKEYNDYNSITNNNDVIISGDYHNIQPENGSEFTENKRKEHLIFEHDSSITQLGDDIDKKIGFEMVTPVLNYEDQKKLYLFLIEHQDDYQIEVNSSTGLHLNLSSQQFDFLNTQNNIDYLSLQYLLDELNIQLNLRLPMLQNKLSELDVMGSDSNREKQNVDEEMKYNIWLYQINKSNKFEYPYDTQKVSKIKEQLSYVNGIDTEMIDKNNDFLRNNNEQLSDAISLSNFALNKFKKIIQQYKEEHGKRKLKDINKPTYTKIYSYRKTSKIFMDLIKYIDNNINQEEKNKIKKQIINIEDDKNERKHLYILQILLLYFDFDDNDQFANEFYNKKVNEYIKDKVINTQYNKYFEDEHTGDLKFANLIIPEYEQKMQEYIDTNDVDLQNNFDLFYNKIQEFITPIVLSKNHQFTIKENRIEFRIIGNEYLDKSVLFYFDHIMKCFYQVTTNGVKEELTKLTKEKIYEEINEQISSENINSLFNS